MNKVQILGTITRDIELRYSQSGSAVANFGIAYNDKWKDQQGQVKEKAHFFDVSVFGKQAETINQYFRKGSRILIDGSLDFQQWEKDGQKHSKVSIKMNGFSFIDRKSDDTNDKNNYQQGQQQNAQNYQQNNSNAYNQNNLHSQGQNSYKHQQQQQQQIPVHHEVIPNDDIPF